MDRKSDVSCDFVVSRSPEPAGSWKVTRAGRWCATFVSFDDALASARRWALELYSRPRGEETRVYIERTRSRLEIDAHFALRDGAESPGTVSIDGFLPPASAAEAAHRGA